MAIKNKIGTPVTGDDFYGRTLELSRAHRYLDECQSLLLSAPRRIGKTSLAKRLLSDKKEQKWKCIYLDLQGIETKEEFLRRLVEAFSEAGVMEKGSRKVKDFFEAFFKAAEGLDLGILKIDLKRHDNVEALYNRLSETFDYDKDTLIIIDELPLFLGKLIDEGETGGKEVAFMLNWLRSLRHRDDSRIRWVFCGSVGLRNFTNHYHMSQAINDLVDFQLGEFSLQEAEGLVKALASSYNLKMEEEVIDHILRSLQWPIPYFLQLLIDRLISQTQSSGNSVILKEDVDAAIENLSQSDYFYTWDERLAEYRDLEELARLILDSLSSTESGLTKESLLKAGIPGSGEPERPEVRRNITKTLEMLEHDGYIIRDAELRKFRSPMLRKWWKYRFID